MKAISHLILFCTTILLCTSCSKEGGPAPDQSRTGNLQLKFDHIVGGKKLQLGTGEYTNGHGELFTIDLLKYYISNIVLHDAAGGEYVVPQDESYYLVDASAVESQFVNIEVPEGDYTQLTFIIGVDSLRSTMPIDHRTGVLDPAGDHLSGGMYWSWNSGYIFFKMEGRSPAIDLTGDPTGQHRYRYHIGGFGGYDTPTVNNIKTIEIDLSRAGTANVRSGLSSNIHLFVDASKVFNGATTVSLAAHPTVMFGDYSQVIANNYQTMFAHDHTHNFETISGIHE